MEENNLPEYGAKVKVTLQLIRKMKIEYTGSGDHRSRKTFKFWKEYPFDGEVLYLGTRILQNGTREYDSDCGYYFNPTEYITVALVSPSPRLNPIYVPIGEIKQ